METVGASRRFFACAHKGGAERPNVRRSRTEADPRSRMPSESWITLSRFVQFARVKRGHIRCLFATVRDKMMTATRACECFSAVA